jgi:HK97 family phage prohead protease
MSKQTKAFEFKESERGLFSGWASRYGEVDHHNDVMMPGAYDQTFRENGGEIPILVDHDVTKLVGRARMTLKTEGLWLDAKLSLDLQDGRDAYVRMRDLNKSGLSIGYAIRNHGYRKDGVRELRNVELLEVSSVLMPALDSARVVSVKSDGYADILKRFLDEVRAANDALRIQRLTNDIAAVTARYRR